MRALLSYQEEKLRRQNKIKSKKYRRVLKKEKQKKEEKELAEALKADPEAVAGIIGVTISHGCCILVVFL